MNAFDQLSKGLANGGLSRRDGLKLAFGGAAFAALSALGVGTAVAAPVSYESLCKGVFGSNCAVNHTQCGTNLSCFCFEHINRGGETYCGCNVHCDQTTTCTNNAQCPPQTLCAINTELCNCSNTQGICVPKCKGKFQNCSFTCAGIAASAKTGACI